MYSHFSHRGLCEKDRERRWWRRQLSSAVVLLQVLKCPVVPVFCQTPKWILLGTPTTSCKYAPVSEGPFCPHGTTWVPTFRRNRLSSSSCVQGPRTWFFVWIIRHHWHRDAETHSSCESVHYYRSGSTRWRRDNLMLGLYRLILNRK